MMHEAELHVKSFILCALSVFSKRAPKRGVENATVLVGIQIYFRLCRIMSHCVLSHRDCLRFDPTPTHPFVRIGSSASSAPGRMLRGCNTLQLPSPHHSLKAGTAR